MDLRKALFIASVVILIAGMGSAVAVYQSATGDTQPAYYEMGDETHSIDYKDSKSYLRDLELYGGKANVLATQLRRFISSIFQGRSLALVIALFSILLSYGAFYWAGRLPGPKGGAGRGRRRREGRP